MLSTPSALAKLRARNKNVFAKLKAAIEASTSKEAKKVINKVLKNFKKAVDASHGGVLLSSIRDDEKESTEREHGVGNERFSKDYDNAVDVNLLDFVESVHSMKDEKMIIAECVPDTTAKKYKLLEQEK